MYLPDLISSMSSHNSGSVKSIMCNHELEWSLVYLIFIHQTFTIPQHLDLFKARAIYSFITKYLRLKYCKTCCQHSFLFPSTLHKTIFIHIVCQLQMPSIWLILFLFFIWLSNNTSKTINNIFAMSSFHILSYWQFFEASNGYHIFVSSLWIGLYTIFFFHSLNSGDQCTSACVSCKCQNNCLKERLPKPSIEQATTRLPMKYTDQWATCASVLVQLNVLYSITKKIIVEKWAIACTKRVMD